MNGLLQLEGVTMRFGGLVALDHLDIDIAAGSIHALIGPNGAGKSTLLNCISRFCTPQEGDIRFNGLSLMDRQPHQIVGLGIARSFQNIEQAHQMTVLENVLVGLSAKTGNYIPFLPGKARQQAEAQASPLIIQIHCKPGQNDQWNRVLAHAFAYALRRLQGVDLPHGQAEITGYPFAITRHKGSRRATALRLDCMTLQPERERSIAAIKILQAVRCAERLGRRQTH